MTVHARRSRCCSLPMGSSCGASADVPAARARRRIPAPCQYGVYPILTAFRPPRRLSDDNLFGAVPSDPVTMGVGNGLIGKRATSASASVGAQCPSVVIELDACTLRYRLIIADAMCALTD